MKMAPPCWYTREPECRGHPTAHILKGSPMDTVQDAARQACRAWFTGEPMGRSMSDLADQLARIDKGQTHGEAYGATGDRTGGRIATKRAGHQATRLRIGRSVQADGKASEDGG
jgi:hypothetical protein